MHRLSMQSTSKMRRSVRPELVEGRTIGNDSVRASTGSARTVLTMLWFVFFISPFNLSPPPALAVEKDRDPVTLRVVAINPSADKAQTVPVRIDLPTEVTPKDVIDHGELTVEFDDDRSVYYVYKSDVQLQPKETKVFEVVVRDLWFIPQERLDQLRSYSDLVLKRLDGTEHYDSAKRLHELILQRLDEIAAGQVDETIGRKTRIGNYRRNLLTIDQIKEDLAKMEKLLSFTGGPPVPEMLKESRLKADAPSTTTTWLVIFMIVIFMGMLGGLFFFTWHRKAQDSQDLTSVAQLTFPEVSSGGEGSPVEGEDAQKPPSSTAPADGKKAA